MGLLKRELPTTMQQINNQHDKDVETFTWFYDVFKMFYSL